MGFTLSNITNLSTQLSTLATGKSAFTDVSNMSIVQFFISIIIFLIILTFIMWVGAFIFNHSLVKVFPSVNKISVGNFLGLYIVLHILFC